MAQQIFDLTPYLPKRYGAVTPVYPNASHGLVPEHLLTYTAEAESDTLLEYWKIVWKHKGAILLVGLFCALATLLVSLALPPVYQAHTSLEIEGLNRNFLDTGDVNPTEGPAPTAMDSYIHSQTEILQEEWLVSRVVDKVKLEERPEYHAGPGLLARLEALAGIHGRVTTSPRDLALRTAMESLKVRAAGDTHVVRILFDSPDPQLAAAFVNALANEFIDQSLQARWESSERMRAWLSRQLNDMRAKLERDETQLQVYARSAGLLYTQDKDSMAEDKLRRLEDELSKATADRVAKQSLQEMATASRPEWLPQVIENGSLRDYQLKLTELRRQLAELTAVLTPTNYKVQRVQAQIAEVESALKRELAAAQKRIDNDFKAAQTREQLLSAAYERQARTVSDQSFKSIRYNTLKREVESTRAFYTALSHRLEQADMAAAAPANNVRILAQAAPPTHPYKPNLFLNTSLGLFAGLFLAVGLVISRERSNRSLRSPGEAGALLNVPEIGVIPSADVDPGLVPFWRHLGINGKGKEYTVEMVTSSRKFSALAEAFREAVASRLFNNPAGSAARVIVLTSPSPVEGKTTVVSNLSIALAQIQRRVLLIDGDLRRSRLHEIFGVENKKGLGDLLRDGQDLRSLSLEALVQKTNIPHLYLLPGGGRSSDVPNILYSDRMAELLERFRAEFDTVLIDAPPTLYLPDARVLARLADGVVLVLRAGKTNRDAALAAAHRLAVDGIRVLGTILNDWNPKAGNGNYPGYATYSRYYGAQDQR